MEIIPLTIIYKRMRIFRVNKKYKIRVIIGLSSSRSLNWTRHLGMRTTLSYALIAYSRVTLGLFVETGPIAKYAIRITMNF